MGYRLEQVSEQQCAGSEVYSCMIIGDYVHTVGEYIERFPIDKATHSLGPGEILGGSLGTYKPVIDLTFDGQFVTAIRDQSSDGLLRYDPIEYLNYTLHDKRSTYGNGIVNANGDFHIFEGSSGNWEIYRFANNQYNYLTSGSQEYVRDMVAVGNLLLVAHKDGFAVYRWDGSSLSSVYSEALVYPNSPTSVALFGQMVFVSTGTGIVRVYSLSSNSVVPVANVDVGAELIGCSVSGNMLCGMSKSFPYSFNVYTYHDEQFVLTNRIDMSVLTDWVYTQTYSTDRYTAILSGSSVKLFKRVLVAQAEFPNGTSGTAPFHLTARAI